MTVHCWQHSSQGWQQASLQQWQRAAPQKPASAERADIAASTTAISGIPINLLIACLLHTTGTYLAKGLV
jgi:hypothetical protein